MAQIGPILVESTKFKTNSPNKWPDALAKVAHAPSGANFGLHLENVCGPRLGTTPSKFGRGIIRARPHYPLMATAIWRPVVTDKLVYLEVIHKMLATPLDKGIAAIPLQLFARQ